MSQKRGVNGQLRFLDRFVCGLYNLLKILSAAMNATRSATRILLKEEGLNKFFFAQKLYNLGPVLNKVVQLKRITEWAWGQSPQPLGNFYNFASKTSNFYRHFQSLLES